MIKVLDFGTDRGDGIANEDRGGATSEMAWIIDGATSLSPGPLLPGLTDAEWLADLVHNYLKRNAAELSSLPPADVFSLAAEMIAINLQSLDYPKSEIPPACSCGVVKRDGAKVSMASVGDVVLYVVGVDTLLKDPLFGEREAKASRVARKSELGALGDVDVRAMAQRRQQYIDGTLGSYILSINPGVGSGAKHAYVESQCPVIVLLCTDGFARLVETYRIFRDWPALAQAAIKNGIDDLIESLRNFESDAARGSVCHFKRRDDVCAMLVEV